LVLREWRFRVHFVDGGSHRVLMSRWKSSWSRWRRVERHVGFAVAVPLCSLGLLLLVFIRIPRRQEPVPMQILVEAVEPEEPVEVTPTPPPPEPPTAVPEANLAPAELRATRINSDESDAEILTPSPGTPESAAPSTDDPTPPSFNDWVPNTEQASELASMTREIAAESRSLQQRQHEMRESIIRMEVTSAAKDFIANSDGGAQGAIRLLNLEGFTTEQVMPVLKRYGFTYERRHITPSAGRSFLNAAVTEKGVYTNQPAEGVYDVLVHSAKSISIMSSREVEALSRAGYDPQRSRVMKVVFGIVRRENGDLDLDVTDLVAEQIR
jgi:hypothetical protein